MGITNLLGKKYGIRSLSDYGIRRLSHFSKNYGNRRRPKMIHLV